MHLGRMARQRRDLSGGHRLMLVRDCSLIHLSPDPFDVPVYMLGGGLYRPCEIGCGPA